MIVFSNTFYVMDSNANEIIENTIVYVKSLLAEAEGGHDWWHIFRVLQLTKKIAEEENVDLLICQLGALFHDIADPKSNGDKDNAIQEASEFLKEQGLAEDAIGKVKVIIQKVSFGGGINRSIKKSPELEVVEDADRLDAMGAIGIARAFHYGGYKNRKIYDPSIKIKKYSSADEYHNSDSPSINHFYEKLLLLKDMMNTRTGKKLAEDWHGFLEFYLDEFFKEWAGEK
jgi:uncharacterized protein